MVAKSGRGWQLAPCLVTLIDETDRLWPHRSRVSDGSIGDERHQATTSDHNPRGGWVTALDITEDNDNGPDLWALWNHLVTSQDPRVKYLIYEGRIASSYPAHGQPAWTSRPYSGINAHERHLHVSVLPERMHAVAMGWWGFRAGEGLHKPPLRIPDRPYPGVIELGDRGPAVGAWQQALAERGYPITVDGIYGEQTWTYVVDWQTKHDLFPDGVAGPRTWHTVLFA